MKANPVHIFLLLFSVLSITEGRAQINPVSAETDTIPPTPSVTQRAKNWGPNDTVIVNAIWYEQEMMPYKELGMVYVSNMSDRKLAKYLVEQTRLRTAVYVTYPYARIAGATINEINQQLTGVTDKKQRKSVIQTREKQLKKEFSDPLTNLSVYQGRVLMKLINRQTGNNCYEILKEYKGGLNARLYQTVAFFVGGNLKQDWDLTDKFDHQIELYVKEIDANWYGNPYRK
jgi:hypothetical protein